ncbi:hypothetical protein [Streptomyces harbinensis]|uniref:hypothetical protein n=1 Tax=Streptomyces harbinensis TaxID=1176198 RepID=UPI0034E028EB
MRLGSASRTVSALALGLTLTASCTAGSNQQTELREDGFERIGSEGNSEFWAKRTQDEDGYWATVRSTGAADGVCNDGPIPLSYADPQILNVTDIVDIGCNDTDEGKGISATIAFVHKSVTEAWLCPSDKAPGDADGIAVNSTSPPDGWPEMRIVVAATEDFTAELYPPYWVSLTPDCR